MTRLRAAIAIGLAASSTEWLSGQPSPTGFARERSIVTNGDGPQRLAIDATLLAGGAPFLVEWRGETAVASSGLWDLRLFDANERPVPYLLVLPPPSAAGWLTARILPVAETKKNSGFEADLGRSEPIDDIRLNGIPAPFLKRLTLEGSGDRAHWTMLTREGTLFDLPDEGLRKTDLSFVRGEYRYLRVTWDDTNSGRVPAPAAVLARRAARTPAAPAPTAAVQVDRRPSEPGHSRYRIRLPGAHLPIVALDLEVGGEHVFRRAVVTESRLIGTEAEPAELGTATLIRVTRDQSQAANMRISIAPPTEAELALVIDDGSNAPLEIAKVSAVFAELPWIYFEAPRGAMTARYGNPAMAAPKYDLEAARESIDLTKVREATWADEHALTGTAASIPAPMPSTGATLETAGFRYSRAIPASAAGLTALALDASALSHSRGPSARFADVRIVDGQNRQVPYLIERRDEPLSIDLAVRPAAQRRAPELRADSRRHQTVYAIELPHESMPPAVLAVETDARVFVRDVKIGVEREPDRQRRDPWFDVIAAATWKHADPATPAPALGLRIGPLGTRELLLTIDEGDNAALPVTAARLLLPSYRLRFFQGADSALRLVYGRDDLSPPQYDLALLAPQVMGSPAREIAAAAETPGSGTVESPLISPRVFWAFLTIAVIVLAGLIARLGRSA